MRASICGEYVFSELGALCAFARGIFSFFVVLLSVVRDLLHSAYCILLTVFFALRSAPCALPFARFAPC